jgi:hypothetical protein
MFFGIFPLLSRFFRSLFSPLKESGFVVPLGTDFAVLPELEGNTPVVLVSCPKNS